MTARNKLLKCQKLLSRKIQRSAKLYVGQPPSFIQQYSGEYQEELKRHDKLISKNKLLDEVLNSQLILCGDYHTLSQAQRTVIRILRDILPRLKKEKKTVYLALEIFKASDAIRIQQYLNQEISEEAFLQAIAFNERGFNWSNYSPLMDLARQWGISVVGLSPDKERSLKSRDQFGAEILANWLAKNSKVFVIALMGDLHLASKHLPGELKTVLAKKNLTRKSIVIHQNHDPLYWKMAKIPASEKAEVLLLKKGIYCILNTPPWLKVKSHLNDLEFQEEPIDEINECMTGIGYFLGVPKNRLGRGEDMHFSYEQDGPSIFLPESRTFQLNEPNLNHLASLAAQYLHCKLSGFNQVINSSATDFYVTIWVEALGYFGSKIINPKRKCAGVRDLAESKDLPQSLAYQHLVLERELFTKSTSEFPDFWKKPTARPHQGKMHYLVARVLGKILGEALFEMTLRERVQISTIRKLFENRFEKGARTLYLDWALKIDRFNLRHFSKKEKL